MSLKQDPAHRGIGVWLQNRPLLLILLIAAFFLAGLTLFWLTPKLGLVAGLCWALVGILATLLVSPPAKVKEGPSEQQQSQPREQRSQDLDLSAHLKLLDSELEQLHDQNWELREAELKYNALLNRQGDIIIHQGDDGTIHFANQAFDDWFDRTDKTVPFLCEESSLIEEIRSPEKSKQDWTNNRNRSDIRQFAQSPTSDTQLHEKRIQTRKGLCWFRWTETLMRSAQRKETLRLIIARDITAYKRVEAESEAKSRFLATISHEMRTPLNGVIGMANLLEQTELNPEQISYVQALRQSGSSLLSLVNDVLDLSRVEAGKLTLKEDWVSPLQIVEEVAELLAPDAQGKGLSIASWMAPDLPEKVLLDPVRVRQILINLLGNAIKFTDKGAINIDLQICPTKEAETYLGRELDLEQILLHFSVRDTGIGIEPQELDRLFEEFEQIDTGRSRRHDGAGLGLAISRHLAKIMQGHLQATSKPGKGSRFSFYLPASALNQEDQDATEQVLKGKTLIGIDLTFADERAFYAYCKDWGIAFQSMSTHQWLTREVSAPAPDHLLINGADPERCQKILDAFDPEKTGILTRPIPRRRIVLIEPSERSMIAQMRESGMTSYLVKPVRKASLLSSLQGEAGQTQSDILTKEAQEPDQSKAGSEQAAELQTPKAQKNEENRLHVLLVEDNEINALLAQSILSKATMQVTLAKSGKEALDIYEAQKNQPFDIALLDLHMPDMDGLTLFDQMKHLDEATGRKIPKLAFTADALQETRTTCLAHGFSDFIIKPIDPPSLVHAVEKHILDTN
ncbi:MAG: ATP-binding protein [Cohaesibacter sp.]|nr:ATP-binding protein [Cohaesibacter sp.]